MMGWLVRVLGWPLATASRISRADAIVVLGAPLRSDGSLTVVLEERVGAGVTLWRREVAPLLCFTGGPTRGQAIPEAEAMAAAARALGVPASAMLLETAARNTFENARFLAELLLPARRNVILVTQPYHLRRARLHFSRFGFRAVGFFIEDSVQFRSRRGLRWVVREYPSLVRDFWLWRK